VTNDEADGGSSPMKMPHEIASEHSFEKKKKKTWPQFKVARLDQVRSSLLL